MPTPPAAPLRYSPAVEVVEPDEADLARALSAQMLKISAITWDHGDGPLRSVHAKSHGILNAVFTVADGLPPVLAQGLFARPGRFDAIMRFSTTPGDVLSDQVSTPRGLALRVLNVPGARLEGSENDLCQDFLMATGKAFSSPDAKPFLKTLKMLAATTDKAPTAKEALSVVLRGAEKALEAVGGESGTLKAMGGYPNTHLLSESFFSQAPVRYGDYIAKVGVVPVAKSLLDLARVHPPIDDDPEALRHAVLSYFSANTGVWEFRVQLCTNLEDMPVEDASAPWPEDKSPYVAVARLEAASQDSWSDILRAKIDTGTAFSPWKGIAAHRPLGNIMRIRKSVYTASANARLERAGCPMQGKTTG
jgi:hypothetical protein